MAFPVDILRKVDYETLELTAKEYMSQLPYRNTEYFSLNDSKQIEIGLCNVSFVPLYGTDTEKKLLALFSPDDYNTVVGLYLLDRWWGVEDVLKTKEASKTGLIEVSTLGERIVLYVLNRIVLRNEKSSEDVFFLCHLEQEAAKILWKDGEAIGFYSFKPKGSLCRNFVTQCYQLPVMDTIFVRNSHRGRGYAIKILEDFVGSFRNEFIGLKFPLSEAMYKVCEKYFNIYPADKELLWEVEKIGSPFQRTLIASRLQKFKLKEKDQVVSKLNFEEDVTTAPKEIEFTKIQETTEYTVEIVEETIIDITKEVDDIPVTRRGRSSNLKRRGIRENSEERLSENIIRVEDIEAGVKSSVEVAAVENLNTFSAIESETVLRSSVDTVTANVTNFAELRSSQKEETHKIEKDSVTAISDLTTAGEIKSQNGSNEECEMVIKEYTIDIQGATIGYFDQNQLQSAVDVEIVKMSTGTQEEKNENLEKNKAVEKDEPVCEPEMEEIKQIPDEWKEEKTVSEDEVTEKLETHAKSTEKEQANWDVEITETTERAEDEVMVESEKDLIEENREEKSEPKDEDTVLQLSVKDKDQVEMEADSVKEVLSTEDVLCDQPNENEAETEVSEPNQTMTNKDTLIEKAEQVLNKSKLPQKRTSALTPSRRSKRLRHQPAEKDLKTKSGKTGQQRSKHHSKITMQDEDIEQVTDEPEQAVSEIIENIQEAQIENKESEVEEHKEKDMLTVETVSTMDVEITQVEETLFPEVSELVERKETDQEEAALQSSVESPEIQESKTTPEEDEDTVEKIPERDELTAEDVIPGENEMANTNANKSVECGTSEQLRAAEIDDKEKEHQITKVTGEILLIETDAEDNVIENRVEDIKKMENKEAILAGQMDSDIEISSLAQDVQDKEVPVSTEIHLRRRTIQVQTPLIKKSRSVQKQKAEADIEHLGRHTAASKNETVTILIKKREDAVAQDVNKMENKEEHFAQLEPVEETNISKNKHERTSAITEETLDVCLPIMTTETSLESNEMVNTNTEETVPESSELPLGAEINDQEKEFQIIDRPEEKVSLVEPGKEVENDDGTPLIKLQRATVVLVDLSKLSQNTEEEGEATEDLTHFQTEKKLELYEADKSEQDLSILASEGEEQEEVQSQEDNENKPEEEKMVEENTVKEQNKLNKQDMRFEEQKLTEDLATMPAEGSLLENNTIENKQNEVEEASSLAQEKAVQENLEEEAPVSTQRSLRRRTITVYSSPRRKSRRIKHQGAEVSEDKTEIALITEKEIDEVNQGVEIVDKETVPQTSIVDAAEKVIPLIESEHEDNVVEKGDEEINKLENKETHLAVAKDTDEETPKVGEEANLQQQQNELLDKNDKETAETETFIEFAPVVDKEQTYIEVGTTIRTEEKISQVQVSLAEAQTDEEEEMNDSTPIIQLQKATVVLVDLNKLSQITEGESDTPEVLTHSQTEEKTDQDKPESSEYQLSNLTSEEEEQLEQLQEEEDTEKTPEKNKMEDENTVQQNELDKQQLEQHQEEEDTEKTPKKDNMEDENTVEEQNELNKQFMTFEEQKLTDDLEEQNDLKVTEIVDVYKEVDQGVKEAVKSGELPEKTATMADETNIIQVAEQLDNITEKQTHSDIEMHDLTQEASETEQDVLEEEASVSTERSLRRRTIKIQSTPRRKSRRLQNQGAETFEHKTRKITIVGKVVEEKKETLKKSTVEATEVIPFVETEHEDNVVEKGVKEINKLENKESNLAVTKDTDGETLEVKEANIEKIDKETAETESSMEFASVVGKEQTYIEVGTTIQTEEKVSQVSLADAQLDEEEEKDDGPPVIQLQIDPVVSKEQTYIVGGTTSQTEEKVSQVESTEPDQSDSERITRKSLRLNVKSVTAAQKTRKSTRLHKVELELVKETTMSRNEHEETLATTDETATMCMPLITVESRLDESLDDMANTNIEETTVVEPETSELLMGEEIIDKEEVSSQILEEDDGTPVILQTDSLLLVDLNKLSQNTEEMNNSPEDLTHFHTEEQLELHETDNSELNLTSEEDKQDMTVEGQKPIEDVDDGKERKTVEEYNVVVSEDVEDSVSSVYHPKTATMGDKTNIIQETEDISLKEKQINSDLEMSSLGQESPEAVQEFLKEEESVKMETVRVNTSINEEPSSMTANTVNVCKIITVEANVDNLNEDGNVSKRVETTSDEQDIDISNDKGSVDEALLGISTDIEKDDTMILNKRPENEKFLEIDKKQKDVEGGVQEEEKAEPSQENTEQAQEEAVSLCENVGDIDLTNELKTTAVEEKAALENSEQEAAFITRSLRYRTVTVQSTPRSKSKRIHRQELEIERETHDLNVLIGKENEDSTFEVKNLEAKEGEGTIQTNTDGKSEKSGTKDDIVFEMVESNSGSQVNTEKNKTQEENTEREVILESNEQEEEISSVEKESKPHQDGENEGVQESSADLEETAVERRSLRKRTNVETPAPRKSKRLRKQEHDEDSELIKEAVMEQTDSVEVTFTEDSVESRSDATAAAFEDSHLAQEAKSDGDCHVHKDKEPDADESEDKQQQSSSSKTQADAQDEVLTGETVEGVIEQHVDIESSTNEGFTLALEVEETCDQEENKASEDSERVVMEAPKETSASVEKYDKGVENMDDDVEKGLAIGKHVVPSSSTAASTRRKSMRLQMHESKHKEDESDSESEEEQTPKQRYQRKRKAIADSTPARRSRRHVRARVV